MKNNLKIAVLIVALANFLYFFVEFFYSKSIHSVALFADSIDFLEDAAVNFIIVFALFASTKTRALVGIMLGFIMLIPSIATMVTIVEKFIHPSVPEPYALTIVALGALAVNISCAFILSYYKHDKQSITKAAYLSAKNDALANIAMIFAGAITFYYHSLIPDMIVGIGIFLLNLDAFKAVYSSAKSEMKQEIRS